MYKQIANTYSGGCFMVVREKSAGIEFIGSGFLSSAQGHILTCAHIINVTDNISVVAPRPVNDFNPITMSAAQPMKVSIVQYDAINDVALLKIDNPPTINVLEESFSLNAEDYPVGSSVGYLGYPYGHSGQHALKFSHGVISSKVLSGNNTRQFQLDTMMHEGNSGGPLIDVSTGKVIGIVCGRYNPMGNKQTVFISGSAVGTESTIAYAVSITYGLEIMRSEGIHG